MLPKFFRYDIVIFIFLVGIMTLMFRIIIHGFLFVACTYCKFEANGNVYSKYYLLVDDI
jgi:hypothetical protein